MTICKCGDAGSIIADLLESGRRVVPGEGKNSTKLAEGEGAGRMPDDREPFAGEARICRLILVAAVEKVTRAISGALLQGTTEYRGVGGRVRLAHAKVRNQEVCITEPYAGSPVPVVWLIQGREGLIVILKV